MKKIDTICVIDDDAIYQMTFGKEVEKSGLVNKVLVFSDGEKAIEFFQDLSHSPEELPGVIFLDINMPVMDGWDFIEEYALLKAKLPRKITVYMVSSSINPIDLERAKNINEISDYLVKPITKDNLISILHKL
jgi:CheY-like chemotaxis protein